LTTNFIAEEFKGGFTTAHLPPADPALLAAVAAVAEAVRNARAGKSASQRVVMLNRQPIALTLHSGEGHHQVDAADGCLAIETNWWPGEPLFRARIDGRLVVVQIDAVGSGWRLIYEGGQGEALVLTPRQAELYALMPVKAAPDT